MATATYVIGLENGVRKLIRTTTTSSGSNDANKLTLLGPTGMLDATLLPATSGGGSLTPIILDREFFDITQTHLDLGYVALSHAVYGEVDATEVQIRNGLCMFYDDDFIVSPDLEGKPTLISWASRGLADTLVVGDKICVKYMHIDTGTNEPA